MSNYMKIVVLAIGKIIRMEMWIDYHFYSPDISRDPDWLGKG
jgi:hypothetical protein